MSAKSILRATAPSVDPLFLERWSPRAFDGSSIDQPDLDVILEAARWAPSAFNAQPWRFLFAHRQDPDWGRFLSLLLPFNAAWAADASVLLFVLSDTLVRLPGAEEATPSRSHSFDTGAAWALLALQATRLGYATRGMTGVDFTRARIELDVPERFQVEAAIALGRNIGGLRAPRPPKSSDRKPVAEYAIRGKFSGG